MERVCCVCCGTEPPYVCPRCDQPYCSVKCYKAHGTTCTESFFKEQVVQEMSISKPRHTVELREALQRNQDALEEDQDLADWEQNCERLEQLALTGELDQTHLTDDQERQFQQYIERVARGEVELSLWRPWWISEHAADPWVILEDFSQWSKLSTRRVVFDATEQQGASEPVLSVPSFSSVARPGVSASAFRFDMCDIILAVAFALRHFDGDLSCDPAASLQMIVSLSSLLSEQTSRHYTVSEIVSRFMERAVQVSVVPVCLVAVYDALAIVNVRMCVRLMGEFLGLFPILPPDKSRRVSSERERIRRKAIFFAAAVQDMSTSDLDDVSAALEEQWRSRCQDVMDNVTVDDERRRVVTSQMSPFNISSQQ
ncbi:HIT-type domain-containing protein [Plasmodiophora brassicae]